MDLLEDVVGEACRPMTGLVARRNILVEVVYAEFRINCSAADAAHFVGRLAAGLELAWARLQSWRLGRLSIGIRETTCRSGC